MRSPSSPPAINTKPQEGHTQPTAQTGTQTPAQAQAATQPQPSDTAPAMGGEGPGKAGREGLQELHIAPERAQAFAQAALVLFGDQWIAPTAHALAINVRTVQRLAKAAHTDQPFPVHEAWLDRLDAMLATMIANAHAARDAIWTQAYVRSPVATGPAHPAPPTQPDPPPPPPPLADRGGAPWTRPPGKRS